MSRDSKKTRVMRVHVEFDEYVKEANQVLGIKKSDVTKIIARTKPIKLKPLGHSVDQLFFDSGVFLKKRRKRI